MIHGWIDNSTAINETVCEPSYKMIIVLELHNNNDTKTNDSNDFLSDIDIEYLENALDDDDVDRHGNTINEEINQWLRNEIYNESDDIDQIFGYKNFKDLCRVCSYYSNKDFKILGTNMQDISIHVWCKSTDTKKVQTSNILRDTEIKDTQYQILITSLVYYEVNNLLIKRKDGIDFNIKSILHSSLYDGNRVIFAHNLSLYLKTPKTSHPIKI